MIRECAGWHPPIPDDTLSDEQRESGVVHGVKGDPIWCSKHAQQIRDSLLELPDLYAQLHTEAFDGTAKPTGVRVSGSRDRPSPAPRIDDADQLARWACDWEDTIRHELGDPAAPHVASGRPRALTEATHYLTTRLTRALAIDDDTDEPTGLMLGQDITNTHRQLQRITARDRLIHELDPPCPACDMRTLRREDGDDFIRCTNPTCRAVWSEIEYERLVLVLASTEGVTA